ncbi:TetR/AcrR family transcriptional regulator [Persicimonas caeni]|uniref:TetR/AcrR family transcriptional regulator n=1 Tax=Persicimonas caeni TaxID=2292766 RepID=A0A4Y6PRV3_PERCE|nr:TetR/AcrR family transcriptional regulator [Persicimonas caeni]QDG50960.1 TetR/AcrR family transcriptional regulator [Persicimonas caeni]QED32181.1 TetR/AcrR family transcriptional regulator [Persicimonas caeni]
MATSRFDNLDPDKQGQILDAAAEEFGEKGYEAASINQIIQKAGISKGSMYYYFEDKRDLFDTTLRYATERMLAMTGGFDVDAITAENFWEYLQDYSRRSLDQLRNNELYIRLAKSFHQVMEPNDPEAPGAETMEWGKQVMRELLERGREFGRVRTDLSIDFLIQLAIAVDSVFDHWLLERWGECSEEELQELMEQHIDAMKRLLSPASNVEVTQ